MSLSVKFNDQELNTYIKVLSGFTPRVGAEWEPTLLDLGGDRRGSIFQYTTYKSKIIPMPFEISGESIEEKYDALMKILNVDEPKPLVFGCTPSKVYYAIPTGSLDMEEVLYYGSGVIEWLVPEGVAYSITEVTAQNNGSKTITVENNGTEAVPISFDVIMKSDNGYFALVLGDRYYQIGHTEEVDGETYDESIQLFDDHFNVDRGWRQNVGVTPPVTPKRDQVGTIKYNQESENEGYAYVSTYAAGDSWHGASISKDLASISGGPPTNWRATWRFDFNADGASSPEAGVGHQSVTFSDEDDNIIVSVVFEDNNPNKNSSDMAVYIGQQRMWTVKNTDDFYVTGRGDNGPCVVVEKIGTTITVRFSYADINKSFEAELPEAKLKKVTWYAAQYGERAAMRNNFFRAINIVRHNVDKWEDIPNYFSAGDELEMEGETGKLYINGVYNTDVVDMGSKTLMLPPGQHTIGILTSDFAQIPDVTIKYRERWI